MLQDLVFLGHAADQTEKDIDLNEQGTSTMTTHFIADWST